MSISMPRAYYNWLIFLVNLQLKQKNVSLDDYYNWLIFLVNLQPR